MEIPVWSAWNFLLQPDHVVRLVEFRNGVEIAVRYGAVARSWPRVEAKLLLDVRLAPVFSRELLASGLRLDSPADLRYHTLIHDLSRDAWVDWFRAAGLGELDDQGPVYTEAALSMQAARLGHGVALGDKVMIRDDLQNGRLVRPFDLEIPCGAYWLVAPDFQRLSMPAKLFADWISLEVGEPGLTAVAG